MESDLKIIDFSMAKYITGLKSLTVQYSMLLFIAPKVIKGTLYDTKVDCQSLGVIIYTLLCAYEPFREKPYSILYYRIANSIFRFYNESQDNISDKVKLFIKVLLQVDPKKRTSANNTL